MLERQSLQQIVLRKLDSYMLKKKKKEKKKQKENWSFFNTLHKNKLKIY